ncbi:MAG: phage portal protein family protein, partial [Akkermansiaceae bacterium]
MILLPNGKAWKPNRAQNGNPTRGLEPSQLERQLTDFARGNIAPLARTMAWVMEHDDICSSVAAKAQTSVTQHGWELEDRSDLAPEQRGMADEQRVILRDLFESLEARDVEDDDEEGGVDLLLNQMLLAYGQRYSVHHLVWTKNEITGNHQLTTHYVPLWHFENSKGRMAFKGALNAASSLTAGLSAAASGGSIPLSDIGGPTAWMVTKGRGVMLAAVIAWMFKHLPMGDWLTYCGRHGMPAFLGKSDAAQDSKEWADMVDAVMQLAAEFAGVISKRNEVEVLNLSGGAIPYPALVERMDRAMAILWRGADLSTLSRGGAVGSSVQSDET